MEYDEAMRKLESAGLDGKWRVEMAKELGLGGVVPEESQPRAVEIAIEILLGER